MSKLVELPNGAAVDGRTNRVADRWVFCRTMGLALGDHRYAVIWAEANHGLARREAAKLRPAWAAHIARAIYEQIGA